jgi:hypothetical protein
MMTMQHAMLTRNDLELLLLSSKTASAKSRTQYSQTAIKFLRQHSTRPVKVSITTRVAVIEEFVIRQCYHSTLHTSCIESFAVAITHLILCVEYDATTMSRHRRIEISDRIAVRQHSELSVCLVARQLEIVLQRQLLHTICKSCMRDTEIS